MMARLRWIMEKINVLRRRRRLPMDHTRAWLTMANPGMLEPGNLYLFDRCIRDMPPGAVIEIGSFCGLSLNHILLLMRHHARDNPVFSADAWEFEGFTAGAACLDGTKIPAPPFQQHIIESFRRNVEFFNTDRLPHHIRLNSDDFFHAWSRGAVITDFFGREVTLGGPIAFAYIDGDHSYAQSLKDFENVDRYLAVGGFVIFDDSADWTDWGSHRAAREAASRSKYELVERAPNYCIRKTAP
jgi:predicted O-methyltransferase YrrM